MMIRDIIPPEYSDYAKRLPQYRSYLRKLSKLKRMVKRRLRAGKPLSDAAMAAFSIRVEQAAGDVLTRIEQEFFFPGISFTNKNNCAGIQCFEEK